jgi:transcription initiation factor IIE alpha subunit
MTPTRTTRPNNYEPFAVVYECPDCEARFLDERRCPDCQLFTRRIDHGGNCPHCDEPVAINDLTKSTTDQEVNKLGH